MDDIVQIPLPTPFPIGSINCYLLSHGDLTLVDPGPATTQAIDTLETNLGELGWSLGDISNILITHPHMDHFGSTHYIAAASDATVISHEDAINQLTNPEDHFRQQASFFNQYLQTMGVPDDLMESVLKPPDSYLEFQEPVNPDKTISDGEKLDIGISLACIHTPGHAVGSVCYTATESPIMFTGDHVLPDTTPNPTLTISPDDSNKRMRSLPTYLESLKKLQPVGDMDGYPGHGNPIVDLATRIDETIAHHNERKETVAQLLSDEPMSPYEVMTELFPQLAATETFAGMSETIGHLDLLDNEGRLEWIESNGIKHCSLAE